MSVYNLKIKTLSPAHIGDGGVYDGMTLLEHRGNFYPIDYKMLITAFEIHNINFDVFKKWVVDKKGSRSREKPRLFDFLRYECPGKQWDVINSLISLAPQQIENLCPGRPNTDIETCITDMNNKPYIPGSELKGAMVTAVMHHFLKDDDDFFTDLFKVLKKHLSFLDEVYASLIKIKELMKKKKNEGFINFKEMNIPYSDRGKIRKIFTMREKSIGKIQDELQTQLNLPPAEVNQIISKIQKWRVIKQKINEQIKEQRKKYDKKRIKGIADEIKNIEAKYWNKYLGTGEKNGSIGSRLMRFLRISDTVPTGSSKIAPCLIIHQDPKITMNLYYEIIAVKSKFRAQLQLEEPGLMLDSLKFSRESRQALNKDRLLEWIYQFSKEILAEERIYFNRMNSKYRFPVNNVKVHLAELQQQNTPTSPLLRIGKGQGFLSLTLALLIKNYDKDIYRKLLGVVQSEKNHPDYYPVTRRLISENDQNFRLPGWVKLAVERRA